jgi:hypothetical protein
MKQLKTSVQTSVDDGSATLLGALNAALVGTVNLIGSPWVLDWDVSLVTVVNVVVGAWVLVGALAWRSMRKPS